MPRDVKSARRVLEVFEHFATRHQALGVMDIARALDYPQSYTSILLKDLYTLGYLDYDSAVRRYKPSLRIAMLGVWLYEEMFADEQLLPQIMEALRDETGETIVLGLENRTQIQYIRILQSEESIRFYIKPGTTRPICHTAIGVALLAQRSATEVRTLTRWINATEPDERWHVSEPMLREQLAQVRRQGYAVTEGSITPGGGQIAVALPTLPGQRPMGMGIGAPLERLRDKRDRIVTALTAQLERLPRRDRPVPPSV